MKIKTDYSFLLKTSAWAGLKEGYATKHKNARLSLILIAVFIKLLLNFIT
jgi:hypothetical protein